eukprot:COSAG01_NODE_41290_length_453_cov_1.158192_1_plen_108_part_00
MQQLGHVNEVDAAVSGDDDDGTETPVDRTRLVWVVGALTAMLSFPVYLFIYLCHALSSMPQQLPQPDALSLRLRARHVLLPITLKRPAVCAVAGVQNTGELVAVGQG